MPQVREAKAAGKDKTEWKPLLDELLAAKAAYRELTGKWFSLPRYSPQNGILWVAAICFRQ